MPIGGEILRECPAKKDPPVEKSIGYYKFTALLIFDCFTKQFKVGMDLDPNSHTRLVDIEEKNATNQQKEWALINRNKNIHTFRFSWVEDIEAEVHDESKAHLFNPKPSKEILDILIINPQDINKRLGNQIKCPTCYKFKECIQNIEGTITGGAESISCSEEEIDATYSIIRSPLERIQYGSPSIESLAREYFTLLYLRNPSSSHQQRFKEVRTELFKRASHLYKCHEFTKLKDDELATIVNPSFFERNNFLYFKKGYCHTCQGDILISLTHCTNTINHPTDSKEYWEQLEKGHVSLFRVPSNPLAIRDPILKKILVVDQKMEFSVIDDNNYVDKNGKPVKDTGCKKAKVISGTTPIPWPLYAYNMYLKVMYTDEQNPKLSGDPTPLWPMKRLQAERYKDVGPYYFPEGALNVVDEDCSECTRKRKKNDVNENPIAITSIFPDGHPKPTQIRQDQDALYITISGRGFLSNDVQRIKIGESFFVDINPPPQTNDVVITSPILENLITIKIILSDSVKQQIKNLPSIPGQGSAKELPVSLAKKDGTVITTNDKNLQLILVPNLKVEALDFTGERTTVDNNIDVIARDFKLTNYESVKEVYVTSINGRFLVPANRMQIIPTNDVNQKKLRIWFEIPLVAQAENIETIEVFDGNGFSEKTTINNTFVVYVIPTLIYTDCNNRNCFSTLFKPTFFDFSKKFDDEEFNKQKTIQKNFCVLKEVEDRPEAQGGGGLKKILAQNKRFFKYTGKVSVNGVEKQGTFIAQIIQGEIQSAPLLHKKYTFFNLNQSFFSTPREIVCSMDNDVGDCP